MSKNKIEGLNPMVDCTTEGLHEGMVCDYKEGTPTFVAQLEITKIKSDEKGVTIFHKVLKSPTHPKLEGDTDSFWFARTEKDEESYYYGGMGRYWDKGTYVR